MFKRTKEIIQDVINFLSVAIAIGAFLGVVAGTMNVAAKLFVKAVS